MSRPPNNGPSPQSVRFRQRLGLIICFGGALYLLAVAIGLLRHAGAAADNARAYERAVLCAPGQSSTSCRVRLPAVSLGVVHDGDITVFRLKPQGRPIVSFHVPTNPTLLQELRARRSVFVEYWRGRVTAVSDAAGHRDVSYSAPRALSENDSVGAFGMLYFSLALATVGIAVLRLPVALAEAGGPGQYRLPYTVRPPTRWMYAVFAAPALAWLGPAFLSAKASTSPSLSSIISSLLGGLAFAALVVLVSVGFAAWYGENRIELTDDGLVYSTLFSRAHVRFADIERWEVRYRRRSTKPQYVDIVRVGEKRALRLQLDMHWRRSKEIVMDVLRRKAPNRRDDDGAAAP
jgi:type IV secretory pathway VirB2 component (pilin)